MKRSFALLLIVASILSFFVGMNVRSIMATSKTSAMSGTVQTSKAFVHPDKQRNTRLSTSPIQQQGPVERGDETSTGRSPLSTQPLYKKKEIVEQTEASTQGNENENVLHHHDAADSQQNIISLNCVKKVESHYHSYYEFSQRGPMLRKAHGPLAIAGFCRLWPPPIHGTGGLQFHAMHLYSQLAAHGHTVHVFVTGHPHRPKDWIFSVNPTTLKLTPMQSADDGGTHPKLYVHQVPSTRNGEYSEAWYDNVLKAFQQINSTLVERGGFQVAHSESWAGVPNTYQIGLQMAVTWHGSMLDWFRNEINLIVHNYRVKRKMPGERTASRMKQLGHSVAFEAYMLLAVPHHIVISDSAAKDLKSINLLSKDSVHLIYNGVNAHNFKSRPDESVRENFLAKHGVRADPKHPVFVIGCGGRLEGIKGHHQLSLAMKIILSQYSNVTLLVAGTGGESSRYEALQKAGFHVVMLGMLKQEELALFYQSLDVFIDPYYQHHGLNTVMIEALLSGVPIVATDLASTASTAPCVDFGLTFSLGVIEELVDRVVFLIQNPKAKEEIGLRVRERALKLFTSSVMAGSYESLLYEAFLHPKPLQPVMGKIICVHTYPAMCYREPS